MILIHNGAIITLDDNGQIFEPGYLTVEGDRITAVEKGIPDQRLLDSASEIIDASDKIVMPGLVNAHTHLFQTFLRGLGDGKPLQQWLEAYIWPFSSKMGAYEAQLAALIGLVENIHSGSTAVIDNQYVHNTPEMDDVFCQAAVQTGVRYLMARGWADRNYHPAFIERGEEVIERVGSLIERWNRHESGRIRVEFGPLSQPRCSTETFEKMIRFARQWNVGVHMHTSETTIQTNQCIDETGLRTVEWLESLNCLDENTRLVHCVWLSDHEIELIAERRAKVVHCPVSNMILASGAARVPDMLKQGVTVALATDGPGSNNNQDMIETLKTALLLHKVTAMDAMALTPETVLWMACRNGAEAFGLPGQIGSLEKGKKADIILVDLFSPFAYPIHRVVSTLTYNLHGSDVDTVMVGGQFLMKHKKITRLDEAYLLKECEQACKSLLKRAGLAS